MNDAHRTVGGGGDRGAPASPPDDRSPPELDRAILDAARRAVRFHRLRVFLERSHLVVLARPAFLVGIVVGALLCAAIHLLLARPSESAAPRVVGAGEMTPASAKKQPADPASPHAWLGHIASLVRNGNLAEAESQLRAFRQRYPDTERAATR
jgi:hypothetical protein